MAGDLIPPPSPAGRPEPDSSEKLARDGGLWAAGEQPERPDPVADAAEALGAQPDAADPAPRVPAPYRSRFGFVLGALIGVALAAVALALVLALDASEGEGARGHWSAWQPHDGSTLDVAEEIAEHVGPQYRDRGKQLVAVSSSGLEVKGIELDGVALRAQDDGNIEMLDGETVMYTLNGLGEQGSIKEGKPSVERHMLVRREALELALYTFQYAGGVDQVVALLPPNRDEVKKALAANEQPTIPAVIFRPGELRDRLAIPLTATIATRTPQADDFSLESAEAQTVAALTHNLFAASYQQGQDAKAYLVLDR